MASKLNARHALSSSQAPPRKRAKLDEISNKPKASTSNQISKSGQPSSFKTVDEIQVALEAHHPDALAKALTTIRNQFTLKQSELPISPSDGRLMMTQQWMGRAPGASDIFKLWEKADPKQNALISLLVSVLSSILSLLSCNYTYHALGTPIIKTLLTPQWIRKFNSYVGGPHADLLLSTLKLWNSIANFASGRERKNVLEAFPWEMKNLPRLLNMRRKSKGSEQVDVLDKPDIRTLYILFLLSFIDSDTSTQIKTTFLEQHRDALLAIFKGLHQDLYLVIRRVLEVFWSGLWGDAKVKRTVKIGLFGEVTIAHLLKLYTRSHPEDGDPDHVPADLIHHFFLAICTRPGQGICFRDRGWYPPEVDGDRTRVENLDADEEDNTSQSKGRGGGRVYNKILANMLKTLKANEDPRQQELTLKILGACPELVAGYWSGVNLTLEPRLSSKWIANISLFGSIISLPIPTTSFLLPTTSSSSSSNTSPSSSSLSSNNNAMYHPTPPPLSTIIENVFPSVNTKTHFSRGIQPNNNALVQHCTALALSKCLLKYQRVREELLKIAEGLQENEDDGYGFLDEEGKEGQWRRRLKDLEKEVRRRVPDFQVVLAFLHHVEDGASSKADSEVGKGKEKENSSALGAQKTAPRPNATKRALLGESAHRLLWLYQTCLPGMVAEARFDVGKLLGSFEAGWDWDVVKRQTQKKSGDDDNTDDVEDEEGQGEDRKPSDKLHDVEQLHILRLLGASEQFSWSAKGSSSKHTNLYILLKTLALNRIPAITQVLVSLLERMLSNSILFQEDADAEEPGLWLACLPHIQRAHARTPTGSGSGSGSGTPDGALLTDEVDSVVVFLDDCVQRCWKTPYRYIDELRALHSTSIHSTPLDSTSASTSTSTSSHQTLSPLLMTVLEQLTIKVANKLLSPSGVLALSTFVRKLVLKLSSQTEDLQFLRSYANKVDEALAKEKLFLNHPVVSQAIRREVGVLLYCLKYEIGLGSGSGSSSPSMEVDADVSNASIQEFLADAEKLVLGSPSDNVTAAFELIDWVRLVGKPLQTDDICKVARLVSRLHPPALAELCQHLDPSEKLLWDGMNVLENLETQTSIIPCFEVLLFNSTPQHVTEASHQKTFLASIFTHSSSLSDLRRVIRIITHALAGPERENHIVEGLLKLIGAVVEQGYTSLSPEDCLALKYFIFNRVGVLKGYFEGRNLDDGVCDALRKILESSLDPQNEDDRRMASEMSLYWSNVLKRAVQDHTEISDYAMTWIQYSPLKEIFNLFDTISGSAEQHPKLLERILQALMKLKPICDFEMQLQKRLSQFLALSGRLPDSHVTNDLVEMALSSRLPIGHDGLVLYGVQTSQLALRWERRLEPLSRDFSLFSYLEGETMTELIAKIVSHAIYSQSLSKSSQAISAWLRSDACKRHPVEELAKVFHAYLDCTHCSGAEIPEADSDVWLAQVSRLVKASVDNAIADESRYLCSACIRLLVMLLPSKRSEVVAKVVKEIKRLSSSSLSSELLSVGCDLSKTRLEGADELIDALVDHSLQWVVRMLASGDDVDRNAVYHLTRLLETVPSVKSHLAEPVLIAVVQDQLHDLAALRLLSALLPKANLKPLVVNRHLQGVVQNPVFFKLCSLPSLETNSVREALIDVLYILFHLHPTNTCQPNHVEPLVQIYRGTVSTPDRKLLSIFQLFEVQRKTSTASLFDRWSANPDVASSSAIEAFQSVDSILVLRTCLHFPHWRTYEEDFSEDGQASVSRDMNVYDPVFLILLFAHALTEDPPQSAFTWVQLFRTNMVGLIIMALSAKDERLRELAAPQIAVLWKGLENADMQEKPHVFLILGLLRDVLMPTPQKPPTRLPSYTTLLLTHALRGIFFPSNFIYPLTARFLLQRPRLDANDVPMLYNMLFSSGDHWKKDRTWIIRFLSNGMQSSADWRVFKRRHTWDLLASMLQSSEPDLALRKGILEVLANVTAMPQAANSLLLKSSLLTWIEMQLLNPRDEECIAWLKVIENIVVVVDKDKMERVTDGEWRACMGRCLFSLLSGCKSMFDLGMLHLVTRVMLRLCLLPGKHTPNIEELLTKVVQVMPEVDMDGNNLQADEETKMEPQCQPPHTAFRLHEKQSLNAGRAWGEAIEALWRISMILDKKTSAWDYLTARLLVWRSIRRDSESVGEWARREVVRSLLA
ncbi:hypothetical protein D9758_003519 [Tetrapyrgos nigripes]|uniref:Nucleolar pre-ribosomal-associated protein 1 n=1 Tax=Tetrapyrgos nigripes TaxID=182062 RepID=A0A8H5LWA0_9AGAR|nr:hypothetical protein D9758_003519 [Tetrapyrgos nigripes]